MSRDGGQSVWQRTRRLVCPTACEPLLTFILAIVYCSAIFWVDLGPLICQGYKLVGGQEGQRWRKKQVRHR